MELGPKGVSMNATIRELGGALWQGLRAALLLRPRASALDIGLGACVALCGIELVLSAASDLVGQSDPTGFNVDGLTREIAFFGVLLAVLACLPFSRVGAWPRRLFVGTVAVIIAVSALFLPIRWAVQTLQSTPAAVAALPASLAAYASDPNALAWLGVVTAWVPLIWSLAALTRLGAGLANRQHLLTGLGLAVASVITTFALPPASMFPGADDDDRQTFSIAQATAQTVQRALRPTRSERKPAMPPLPRIDAEAVMTRQPELLAAALKPLLSRREDRAELYYVSMAPFSGQDVFKRESTAVKALFDDRFGTAGRSVALVNHRDTVDTHPLASMSNLDVALKHIGGLMRPDKDVLMLFLTSHGTEGIVSVQFPRFPLNDITPARLAQSLDAAGIKNRVLVISACHSGSFVPTLANEHTLIMTAARADRTSFGCSNEAEWTYFGDAYFNHALRTESSFIDAFQTARTLITTWEAKQKFTPSEPQISVGAKITAILGALPAPSAPSAPPEPKN
jgi:hypothetical protein